MPLVTILHRFADYDAFRRVYDSADGLRQSGGVTDHSVHRMADDPSNVLVLHYFDSLETARAFVNHPGLRDAMQQAGMQGEPRFEFYE
ncbi:antibiotic biosynthesis monooxygenase [Arthrobacter sp. W4I7]|uniref:antibiotic biosynthesis monooxygenase n=1 Tax=Arthrobacter sp. W4I7 TaxID=3042296 RepID=UPI00277DCCBB|nr:antibiotic biosynthesis monooxygenase [Arthrobacter sp. W4I7]MDQ0690224.1 heme-degrading monooxygenase HmoA [Arthrobacter sp. W4I7]